MVCCTQKTVEDSVSFGSYVIIRTTTSELSFGKEFSCKDFSLLPGRPYRISVLGQRTVQKRFYLYILGYNAFFFTCYKNKTLGQNSFKLRLRFICPSCNVRHPLSLLWMYWYSVQSAVCRFVSQQKCDRSGQCGGKKHFTVQLMHTNSKILRLLKQLKLYKLLPTCFGPRRTIIREPYQVLS